MNLEALQAKFGSRTVKFKTGAGKFTFLEIKNRAAEAEICLHGGHLMKYVPAGQLPVLWMSEKSWFETNKPIRGGVPVCWPYFGPAADPAFPTHGFARLSEWHVADIDATEETTRVVLALAPEDVTAVPATFAFELEMEFVIGATLEMTLRMKNRSAEAQTITAALHSYFNVKAAEAIAISGLNGVTYDDRVIGAEKSGCVQEGDIRIDREIDRIYLGTAGAVEIRDPGFGRTIRVEKSGSNATVVWNPWIRKSKAMSDFGDEEYHTMVCVEAVNAAADRRTLPPGGTHALTQKVSVR